jgi:uncharacterized phage infection (PIP) family protein YhgE
MKKLVTILLILSFSLVILPTKAFAQEDTTTVEAGLTPDSPLYFLDKFLEEIELFFTTDETEKIEKKLKFVEERLAEMEEISDTATKEELEVLGEEYEEEMEEIEDDGEGQSEEVKAHVMEMREKHIMVLERVMENAPEQAQPALNSVIDKSKERLGIVDEEDDAEEGESVEIEEEVDKDKEEINNINKLDTDEETSLGQKISEFVKSLGNSGRDIEEENDMDDGMNDIEKEEIRKDDEIDETEEE